MSDPFHIHHASRADLEGAGILGGFEGSKPQRVMIPNEAALAAHLGAASGTTANAGPGMGGF